MEIKSPKKVRTIEEWDFVAVSGMVWPVTLDLAAGDTMEYQKGDPVAVLRTVEKESPISTTERVPAEEIIIPMQNVFVVRHRTRDVETLTKDEKEAWQRDLKAMIKVSAVQTIGEA
ncbi:hypothetical protein HY346_01480 [Candidatus Microgenomates bacterium]|nr:hypothetical protein [Candidatus Microgenomates bacterium]